MTKKCAYCTVKVKRKTGEEQKFVFKDHYLPATNASLENQLADA